MEFSSIPVFTHFYILLEVILIFCTGLEQVENRKKRQAGNLSVKRVLNGDGLNYFCNISL